MSDDLWSSDGAVCPYCSHVNRPENDNWSLYSEDTDEFNCTDCNEVFIVSPFARWAWTTRAKDVAE